jgi:hypothetical protein
MTEVIPYEINDYLCRPGSRFRSCGGREEESGPRGFSVDFFACTEFVGVGPVDFARASTLVPSSFTILTVGAAAALVVRATNCASATANNARGEPTIVSQIGIEIVPSDKTGDINNYTLLYVTITRI